ncbi:MAG: cytochrome c [Acidimicrobiia bacterium]|nr:cytochrome c [Acidimicrobiia bacterium]
MWRLHLVAVVALSSCASADRASPTVDLTTSVAPTTSIASVTSIASADGAALFAADSLGGEAGCSSCHSMQPDRSTSGPSLAGIGTIAATRVAELGAEHYLRQSILEPEAFFAPGWGAGMPAYSAVLSDTEADALVTYLLTIE